MNLPPPRLRLVVPSCFDPCRSLLGRIVARRAADARQAEAYLILTAAMVMLGLTFGGYLGWALVPPGSRLLFTAMLVCALLLMAASLIGRRPAIIVEAGREGLIIRRHKRRVRKRTRVGSNQVFRADAGAVGDLDTASLEIERDIIEFRPGDPVLRSASDEGARARGSADHYFADGALPDELYIPYSAIERTARIDPVTFHRHYRRYAQTRVFVNRIPSELILMRVSDPDSVDHVNVDGRRGGEPGLDPASGLHVPIILGLAVESDRIAFEELLTEVASVAPASSWADVV